MPVHTAIDGTYRRGELQLDEDPATDWARVTVIFRETIEPDDEPFDFASLATMLPPEAAEEMARNIEEAFEQVDEEEA